VHSSNTPPLSPSDQALSDQFDSIYAGASDLEPFRQAARDAHAALIANYLGNVGPTNWIHFTNIGHWGDAYLDRASITEYIQFGNAISTAAYYHAFTDVDGEDLSGSNPDGYVLTFPPGTLPEAERFWSLTAYTPHTIELIPNPADKYLVASYTDGLEYEDDGTLHLYLSQEQPAGTPAANWLPVSDDQFNVMLRIYGVVPGSSVAADTYEPPAIRRFAIDPPPSVPSGPTGPVRAAPGFTG
jgi:hypothetical protein